MINPRDLVQHIAEHALAAPREPAHDERRERRQHGFQDRARDPAVIGRLADRPVYRAFRADHITKNLIAVGNHRRAADLAGIEIGLVVAVAERLQKVGQAAARECVPLEAVAQRRQEALDRLHRLIAADPRRSGDALDECCPIGPAKCIQDVHFLHVPSLRRHSVSLA